MQQSRLDKFFTMKKSSTMNKLMNNDDGFPNSTKTTTTNQLSKKRLLSIDKDNSQKLKHTKSNSFTIKNENSLHSNEHIETNSFSLNQFYLNKFLSILLLLIKNYKHLFDENELVLFDKFQILSG